MDARSIAYHEAGHAVWLVSNGVPLRYVTIRPRRAGVVGCVLLRPFPDEYDERRCSSDAAYEREKHRDWARFVSSLCGPFAEAKATGRPPEGADFTDGGSGDREQFVRGSSWPPAKIDAAHEEAEAFIESHWPQIEAVALALLERKTLTQAEVRTLLLKKTQ